MNVLMKAIAIPSALILIGLQSYFVNRIKFSKHIYLKYAFAMFILNKVPGNHRMNAPVICNSLNAPGVWKIYWLTIQNQDDY